MKLTEQTTLTRLKHIWKLLPPPLLFYIRVIRLSAIHFIQSQRDLQVIASSTTEKKRRKLSTKRNNIRRITWRAFCVVEVRGKKFPKSVGIDSLLLSFQIKDSKNWDTGSKVGDSVWCWRHIWSSRWWWISSSTLVQGDWTKPFYQTSQFSYIATSASYGCRVILREKQWLFIVLPSM